jgi:hypothetical protein
VREPLQRLTQHKRLGGRSLSVSWDREEAPALHFKGSKPGAATAGWSLISHGMPLSEFTFGAPSVSHGPPRFGRVQPPAFSSRMRALLGALLGVERHSTGHATVKPGFPVDRSIFSANCLRPDRRLIVELNGRSVHGAECSSGIGSGSPSARLGLARGGITWRQLRDDEARVAADLRLLFKHER